MKGTEIDKKKVPKLNLDFKVQNDLPYTSKGGISGLNQKNGTDTGSLPEIFPKTAKEKPTQLPFTPKSTKSPRNLIDLSKFSSLIDESNKNFLNNLRSFNDRALTSLDYDRLSKLGLDQKYSPFQQFSDQSLNEETTLNYFKMENKIKSKTVTESSKPSINQIQTDRARHDSVPEKETSANDLIKSPKVPSLTSTSNKFKNILQKINPNEKDTQNIKLAKLENISPKPNTSMTKRNSKIMETSEDYYNIDTTERNKGSRKVSLKENSKEMSINSSENKNSNASLDKEPKPPTQPPIRDDSKKKLSIKLKAVEKTKPIPFFKSETHGEINYNAADRVIEVNKTPMIKMRTDLSSKLTDEKNYERKTSIADSSDSPHKSRTEEKHLSVTKSSIKFSSDNKQSYKNSPEKSSRKMIFSPLNVSQDHSMRSGLLERGTYIYDGVPDDSLLENNYAKFSNGFSFKKKNELFQFKKVFTHVKNEFEEEFHTRLEDEILKPYETVMKNISKSQVPSNVISKGDTDAKGLNQKRSANLEELLKEADEDKKDDIVENTPSILKQKTSGQTVFSFKDQVIIINIKPPIDEINEIVEESDKYDDDGTPTAKKEIKEVILKFDVKVKNNNNNETQEHEDSFYQDIETGLEIKDESSKRKSEELFTFDEIYESNIDHLSFKSFKSTCRTNFFAFVDNLMNFPIDSQRHKEFFEKSKNEKDANTLDKPLGFYYDQKWDFFDWKNIEFKVELENECLSFVTKEEIAHYDKKTANIGLGIENDLKKNEQLLSTTLLLLENGGDLKIVSEVPDWKVIGREFEKKSLVNFFDHASFSKRLSQYFKIDKIIIESKEKYQTEQQNKYRLFNYRIANFKSKNFNYIVKLTYKTYNSNLYGNFEHLTILGEEKVLKRREKKDKPFNKTGNRIKRRNNKNQIEEAEKNEKQDDMTVEENNNTKEMSVIGPKEDKSHIIRNHAVRPFEMITPSETRTSNMLNLSPRHASSIVGQSHQPSLDFNRLKLKSDTEKLSVRMKTEELSSGGADSSKSSVRKKSETLPKNETLQRLETSHRYDSNQKVESVQRMETTIYKEKGDTARSELHVTHHKNDLATRHSLTTDIKSKFADFSKRETMNTAASIPSHSTLPTHHDDSTREARETRDVREGKEKEPRERGDTKDKDSKEPREGRDGREYREAKEPKEPKEQREPKEPKERELREPKEIREPRPSRDLGEPREIKEPRISMKLNPSPIKSENHLINKTSYNLARENPSKNELRDDSAKSNEMKMKNEAVSPDIMRTTDFTHGKMIMNQNNQKMIKSSQVIRNHKLTQRKRNHMSTEELFFSHVLENKVSELIDLLSNHSRESVETRNQEGDTLLIVAAKCGHLQIVSYLITSKIDINAQNNNGDTALHNALAYGHHDVADELIKNGAKQNLRNNQGKLAWEVAI